jgi:hypothetical protein
MTAKVSGSDAKLCKVALDFLAQQVRLVSQLARRGQHRGAAIRFFTRATIAVKIAPAMPPAANCPIRAPMSTALPACASAGIRAVRSCPPTPPPIAPAIVFPAVPRLSSFEAPHRLHCHRSLPQ